MYYTSNSQRAKFRGKYQNPDAQPLTEAAKERILEGIQNAIAKASGVSERIYPTILKRNAAGGFSFKNADARAEYCDLAFTVGNKRGCIALDRDEATAKQQQARAARNGLLYFNAKDLPSFRTWLKQFPHTKK